MAIRDRIRKYREEGGAAGLVRVEVLVPPEGRAAMLAAASALRGKHRHERALDAAVAEAIRLYGIRATENIDLSKLPDAAARARSVARGLMERGDARAYVIARHLVDLAQDGPNGSE
jgi:hypothetical protein